MVECLVISFKAEVDSLSGHETLTISPPTSEILLICLKYLLHL